ncbi:HET domain-containing protein [Aspergillus vadensis CBS 113365]|uniref:HET-domain-containing protein n=1 Tax=Aspergillus vadensis (strain CBS 113365 / IMI 142717 / IBT 24658) TaxID=1448311 RepID=A0A319B4R5_ASPVC|nr:HET-domain-containing protein [Aspergillus vadensis CBS 113365]PYH67777.1 HET-domain-containing protein [Aspergillus vadensis CBS 113365]
MSTDRQNAGEKRFLGTIEPTHGHQLVSTPMIQQEVEWHMVLEWLRECFHTDEHKDSCQRKPDGPQISGLRVIDTKRRRITIAPARCRYATLSYVLGNTSSSLQATTVNIAHLTKRGSLRSSKLPQTIDDAIVACRKMKIDYLWVDRLCILQDDNPDRKAYWLNSMGQIYAQSYITLIALAGNDAEHGLPGVNKVKRMDPWAGTTQGIFLRARPPYYDECLLDSRWVTRGWTFQEAVFATRRLSFSDTTVFWDCSHPRIIYDEIYGARYREFWERTALRSYRMAVEEFTKRELTWEWDVLHAFAGVLHTRWGPESYYGFPLSNFSEAMLWTAIDKVHPTRYAAPGDAFPTWSWSSIKGPINIELSYKDYPRFDNMRSSTAIWAIPSRLSEQPALQLITNASRQPEGLEKTDKRESLNDKYLTDQCRLLIAIAWKCGCFSGSLPKGLNTTNTWEECNNIVLERRPLAQLSDEAHGMPWGKMSDQDLEARFPLIMRQECPPGSIFVYTQSLNLNPFKLSLKKHRWWKEDILVIAGANFVAPVIPGSINLERINRVRQRSPNSLFMLIALSVTTCERTEIAGMEKNNHEHWYDSAGKSLSSTFQWPLEVELMLVATENGVSRRVGLATAYLRHWVNQNPRFRTFHLV